MSNKGISDLTILARDTVNLALKNGCKESSATAYRSRDVELGWRDGKVEKVSEATTRGVSVQLYVDGRYSSVSTSDLRPDALNTFLRDSIAMARTLAADPNRALPDPKLYPTLAQRIDLGILDSEVFSVTPEQRRKLAKDLEDAARGVKGSSAIVSVSTNVSDSHSRSARVSSNGLDVEHEESSFWLSASVACKDADGRRPEDGDYAGSHFFQQLPTADDIGRRAAERTLATLGAKKIESGSVKLVIENRAARRMLGALIGPLSARALQQKQSFLDGQIGKPIASKLLTAIDDPLLPHGLSSRIYDSDGIAAKKRPIIEAGVLKTYFIDVYYGRKLGVTPTMTGPSNLIVTPGTKDAAALLKDVGDGILITGFLGGNSSATTGDYSFGFQGFRIRGGLRGEPISEMNVSGNFKDLWKKLVAVGNDPYPYSGTLVPTLVFDGIQVAGL